jgi:hypothetical protein
MALARTPLFRQKGRVRTPQAVAAIEKHGALLVYPIDNRKEPLSLWSVFHPRTPMRWEWDEDGDDRVSRLWHLRAELSASSKVVYAKWFRGRATFFSREVFTALLAAFGARPALGREARELLEALALDSPLSTKQLKRATGLTGRLMEPTYERAMKELWQRFLIVGYGEVDDGAFPSLAVGSAQVLFEDLHEAARALRPEEAWAFLEAKLAGTPFLKQAEKLRSSPLPPVPRRRTADLRSRHPGEA